MGFIEELQTKELARRAEAQATVDALRYTNNLLTRKANAVWAEAITIGKQSVEKLNAGLPAQKAIANFSADGLYAFEVTKYGGLQTVGWVHLNSSANCIEFKVSYRHHSKDYLMSEGEFKFALSVSGEALLLDLTARNQTVTIQDVIRRLFGALFDIAQTPGPGNAL
jgi:hypothetical protein